MSDFLPGEVALYLSYVCLEGKLLFPGGMQVFVCLYEAAHGPQLFCFSFTFEKLLLPHVENEYAPIAYLYLYVQRRVHMSVCCVYTCGCVSTRAPVNVVYVARKRRVFGLSAGVRVSSRKNYAGEGSS